MAEGRNMRDLVSEMITLKRSSSSERMFDLKNKTQYAYFKNNNPNNINACNLPVKSYSYQSKYDIKKGSDLCNMNIIIKNN